jgi:glycosyltransferase involved in cell wall biosynthesis
MRVSIVIGSLASGGAERVAANLANAWAERGWAVSVVSLAPQSLDFYRLSPRVQRRALGVSGDTSGLLSALRANSRRIRALRRALRELAPDAVVAMTRTIAVLAILAARGLRSRVIAVEHTYPPLSRANRPWDILRSLTYPSAHRISMLTSEGLLWLREHVPRARGVVIPNPVVHPLPVGDPKLSPERLVPPERRLLLAVGRLIGVKQFDRLVAAFASLAPRRAAWHLVILGEGPERAALERQAMEIGLSDRVSLPGRVGNVGDWYGRADLYALSSRQEGFPNTLVEAMAHGCPAVSYDCDTGPRDIIRHGVDGLLVRPVGDVAALAAALARLMDDDSERAKMAARAVEVRSRYSMDRILAAWDEVLEVADDGMPDTVRAR